MKTIKINIPEGAKTVNVKIDGEYYPLVLEFDDKRKTYHFWLEDGKYDGRSSIYAPDAC